MEAFGKLVENSFPLLSLSTEHQGLEETTEGSVQALTFELEEGQVGLGYSPAEVIVLAKVCSHFGLPKTIQLIEAQG